MSDAMYPPHPIGEPDEEGHSSVDLDSLLASVQPQEDGRPERPEVTPAAIRVDPTAEVLAEAAMKEVDPNVPVTTGRVANIHGPVGIVADNIGRLIFETRKQDILEGEEVERAALLGQPFVRGAWGEAWKDALDPMNSDLLRAPVLIVVAPRAIGSTTFALRLLAEHTADSTVLVKLQADGKSPGRMRLPLERHHAFQLDLKDPETDRVSAEFLTSLTKHAQHLADCASHLVLTVAQELWDAGLVSPPGVQVLRLTEAPDAGRVVSAHLRAGGYPEPAGEIDRSEQALAQLRGLNAVAAVRAVGRIVAVWREHLLDQQTPAMLGSGTIRDAPKTFEERVLGALSDWRESLDGLFGDHITSHGRTGSSLAVEDRYLLLALAVRQSAPVSVVAADARELQLAVESASSDQTTGGAARAAFAARGLRRRIQDVGATVDGRDRVVFDRPAYGRAVLEYVWDNYEVLRVPLLSWLAKLAAKLDPQHPVVETLASLALRHGTREHLNKLAELADPGLLGAILRTAVHDEHVGSLVWATLYQWADTGSNAPTVVSTCRLVLADPEVSPAAAKMAVVRLRRVAQKAADQALRQSVLMAFDELARREVGRARLVAEVETWQQSKGSSRSGTLAFLALMSVESTGLPWLLAVDAPGIDVQQALMELLGSPESAVETIPRITDWIRSCAEDSDSYMQLRDQLLVPLRGHRMFQAGMDLMKALTGSITAQGVDIAEDFYHHLVGAGLQGVFPSGRIVQ
ncbi:hypothetical protein ACFV1L_34305 [Kitasatospora sp. NPDC059646]|uniref:hypothetical protein n=1 Tax=Kitasatospora sp. NPDC059646 TaxID=3346893 RepID=UPI0036892DB8